MNNAPLKYPLAEPGQSTASRPWGSWFTDAARILIANEQSGTTANRPTEALWIGRRYFDTTLNKPVFVSALGPPGVWRDAAGTVV